MKIPAKAMEQILAHGGRAYPGEACGLLVGPEGGDIRVAIETANVIDELHAEDPEQFPRTSRTGYVVDPSAQYRIMKEADAAGEAIRGIYHSHADTGAYFSDEDKAQALPFGQPAFPDAVYIVADVQDGEARGAKAYVWSPDAKDFVEEPIEVVQE